MSGTGSDNGWLEAAVAWEVCASLHRQYCKGKDALFTTRQSDFVKHAENARVRAHPAQEARVPLNVDALAQEIRRVDGNHSLGAGALAEALLPWITAAQKETP